MKYYILLILFLFVSTFALSQTDSINWEGEYNYVQKSDNPNHEWHYELKVTKTDSVYSANFTVWGHQTFWPLNCSVTAEGNKAMFYFVDYSEPPGVNFVEKGNLVLTLEYDNNSLITTWERNVQHWENFPASGPNKMQKIK
ncbi:MAG TPA: DUF5991 domain-containing protein [Ignavibacteria bacterium]